MQSLRKPLRLYIQTREIMIFILVSRTICLFVPTFGACIEFFLSIFPRKAYGVKKSFRMSGNQVASGTFIFVNRFVSSTVHSKV